MSENQTNTNIGGNEEETVKEETVKEETVKEETNNKVETLFDPIGNVTITLKNDNGIIVCLNKDDKGNYTKVDCPTTNTNGGKSKKSKKSKKSNKKGGKNNKSKKNKKNTKSKKH
jgi:hypothetical protein